MILTGRKRIYTDYKEINRDNIIEVLKKAYSVHCQNAREIQYLMDYEKGIQPLQREKKIRPEINIEVTDNMANYIKKFHIGYFWSSPIPLIQRGSNEMHKTNEQTDSMGITALNEMLKNGENITYKDQCMAEFYETAGIGHKLVDVKTDFDKDTLFWNEKGEYFGSLVNDYYLDSRYAFCVYHNGVGQKKLMGVTFSKVGGKLYFTCFTDKERFEISGWKIDDVQKNPLEAVSIVEYERSFGRTGCFEHSMSEMDELNILVSDYGNDVAQRTQEIWWGDNIEFPKDEKTGKEIKPESGQWLLTFSREGAVAKIQPLSSTADNTGTLTAIDNQRNWILMKCNVPIQYDSAGGGSTGVATSYAAGWKSAEDNAMQKQQMVEKGKREELNLILKAIRLVPTNILPADSPIRSVHSTDVEFKFTRRNDVELTTQMNAVSTGMNIGIHPRHLIPLIKAFPDPEQVYVDSKPTLEAFQKSKFENGENTENTESERTTQDLSDQSETSPYIDGLRIKNKN